MKKTINFQCLIILLCLIITLTSLPDDSAALSIKTCSEREFRELEKIEMRCVQTKQVVHFREYYFLRLSECRSLNAFLFYAQQNYQPQVQSHILASYSIHSPPFIS